MARAGKVLVRIGATVWEFSRADFKRFGGDVLTLKMRSPSARTAFVSYGDEWFRWTGQSDYATSNQATPAEITAIRNAVELHEPKPTRRPW